jgi:Uma2 family endonuclease
VILAARQRFTFAEYVSLEEISRVKHEFLDGHVWAMAGGSPEHAAVAVNIVALLHAQLRDRPCRVYTSDLRIRVRETGLGTYPDVTVICGRVELDPEDPKQHTATNPKLIVEVLSPSTEDYDRGEKLAHYKRIPSLEEVVLVAHEERRLELWRREGNVWTAEIARGDAAPMLRALECRLPLAEVYRNPIPSA